MSKQFRNILDRLGTEAAKQMGYTYYEWLGAFGPTDNSRRPTDKDGRYYGEPVQGWFPACAASGGKCEDSPISEQSAVMLVCATAIICELEEIRADIRAALQHDE